jgi:CheY-like chemotaxis protein/HPt (histidine-containing phosphotransfer) domain-containing protein
MNIISGYLDLVREGKLDKSQQEKINVVKKSADHLIQLLNNLLDMSKMQAGKLEMLNDAFEPREIIRDMELWFGPAAREKGIKLETFVDAAMPQWLSGDPVRLKQILFNLTGNAIKFTASGKVTIRLTAGELKHENIWTILEVSDTGIGISPRDQQRIFGQFEQVNAFGSAVTEGSGLGLAITQQLVKLMQGDIELKSTPGKGSTFRLTIPFGIIGDHDPDTLPANEKYTSLLSGLNVLVVDDEPYNRKLVKMMLVKYHCKVAEAESGGQAVEIALQGMVDLILMDIRMKGMSGIQAARAIREQEGRNRSHIPVIAISAEISHEDYINLKANGIDEFLAKPFDEAALIRAMLRQVRHFPPDSSEAVAVTEILNRGDKGNKHPRYDITSLIATSNGNENFLKEMLGMFIENTSKGLEQIQAHFARQEWHEATEIAHKISGPCRHLKAMDLLGYLKEIQEFLNGDIHSQQAEKSLQQAMNEFERIREDILHIIKSGNYNSHE